MPATFAWDYFQPARHYQVGTSRSGTALHWAIIGGDFGVFSLPGGCWGRSWSAHGRYWLHCVATGSVSSRCRYGEDPGGKRGGCQRKGWWQDHQRHVFVSAAAEFFWRIESGTCLSSPPGESFMSKADHFALTSLHGWSTVVFQQWQ